MFDYPQLCIGSDSYQEEPMDGSTLSRAEDGTPVVVILYPAPQRTFTITHRAMTAAQQVTLEQFYEGAKGGPVRFFNPRYGNWWEVLMVGPPRLVGMPSPMLADVQMTLTGAPE